MRDFLFLSSHQSPCRKNREKIGGTTGLLDALAPTPLSSSSPFETVASLLNSDLSCPFSYPDRAAFSDNEYKLGALKAAQTTTPIPPRRSSPAAANPCSECSTMCTPPKKRFLSSQVLRVPARSPRPRIAESANPGSMDRVSRS